MSKTIITKPYDPTDENADHLAQSRESVNTQRRTERRRKTGERVVTMLKAHGNGYRSASPALRSAAERHFGSWAKACHAAGLDAPVRGRPRKDAVGSISQGEMRVPVELL